jgi:hypothetical protein
MRNLLRVCICSALFIAAGCADDDELPPAEGLAQGLTIFTADPQTGVTGMFARGDLAVFFETARELELEPAPQHDHFTKDGIAVNVSARFMDLEGRNLLVSMDAHLMPVGWTTPGEPSEAMMAVRPALYELTFEAGLAIEAAALDDTVAPEVRALAVTGVLMRPPQVADPAPRSTTSWFSDGWDHWQYFEVHSASCCGIAEHSATVFWNWSESGGWEEGYQTSNHGRWAMEMGIEPDCGGTGAWGGGGRPHYHGDNLQYCDMKNGYAVCGMFGGNHNCHDDSKLQRENIVYGRWFGSAPGYCSGWGCDVYAPGCY